MKKDTARGWITLAAVLAVYNVIAFAVPVGKGPVFFLSWAFTMIAIAAQIYVLRTAFGQGGGARSRFYGFPIAKIGVMYLAVQLVLGLAFMVLGTVASIPMWIPLVIYIILLGASAIGFVAADATRDEIVRQDAALKADVSCMRSLQSKTMAILGQTGDGSVREAAGKFAEALRFSDPVSSKALREIELELTDCVEEIQRAVTDDDSVCAIALLNRANVLLLERNRLCKLNKSEKS